MSAKTSRVATYASIQNNEQIEKNQNINNYIRIIIKNSKKRHHMKHKIIKEGDICLEKYENVNKMMLTKCYHHFHKKCIRGYKGRECPMCRRKL